MKFHIALVSFLCTVGNVGEGGFKMLSPHALQAIRALDLSPLVWGFLIIRNPMGVVEALGVEFCEQTIRDIRLLAHFIRIYLNTPCYVYSSSESENTSVHCSDSDDSLPDSDTDSD